MKKKKCKESKDKLIIDISDYFVLHKILETANSENQDFRRHHRLKVDFFGLTPKAQRGTFSMIPVYERVGVSLADL